MPPGYHKWILILLAAGCFMMRGCYLEQVVEEEDEWIGPDPVIQFDHVDVFADLSENLLLYTLPGDTIPAFSPFVQFGDYQSVTIDGTELSPGRINDLGEVTVNHPYTVRVRDKAGTETFELYFTTLPVSKSGEELRLNWRRSLTGLNCGRIFTGTTFHIHCWTCATARTGSWMPCTSIPCV